MNHSPRVGSPRRRLDRLPKKNVLGIMSGTSMDGVDCAVCEIQGRQVTLLHHWRMAFPKSLRARLQRAARNDCTSHELAQAHHDLGRFYVQAVQAGPANVRIALAGLHGQTIFHSPDRRAPATFQLGEPAYLAETLRVPVVSNFRAADLAAKGQGAPLATLFHQLVFGSPGAGVCVNNLGGISNVTWLGGTTGKERGVLAFDTGPGNMLMDLAMRHLTKGRQGWDQNGRWAARGRASDRLLSRWLEHPFFSAKPPKSTGRELFGEPFLERALREMERAKLSSHDILATLSEFTARSIRLNYELHLPAFPAMVVLAGGGAANPDLAARIRSQLQMVSPGTEVKTSEQAGWPCQAVEAGAFALLAYCRAHGVPGNLHDTTGAEGPRLLGQVSESGFGNTRNGWRRR
jgi:anhydro-N-acetylmuramic acid kinase